MDGAGAGDEMEKICFGGGGAVVAVAVVVVTPRQLRPVKLESGEVRSREYSHLWHRCW